MNVVDYITVHYEVILDQAVPSELYGKFVVLTNEAESFAVFAPIEMGRFHAQIVARFLTLQGVAGTLNTKGDDFAFHDPRWTVQGGGHWERSIDGELRIFGDSDRYGGLLLEPLASELAAAKLLGVSRVRTD